MFQKLSFCAQIFIKLISLFLSDSLLARQECGGLILPVITSLKECMLVTNIATSMWKERKPQ